LALKADIEKATHTLAELQTSVSAKNPEHIKANDVIEDHKMKVTTLAKSLDAAKEREKILMKDLQNEKALLASAANSLNELKSAYKLWTDRLGVFAENLTAQLSAMGLPKYRYSTTEGDTASARLTLFFESLIEALEKYHGERSANFASESRKFCSDVLSKVLVKIVCRNPGIDISKAFKSLPKGTDTTAVEELVTPIVSKVHQIPRIEGQRRD
jgi:hypothetical protein